MCYLILRGTFLSGSVNTRKVNSATSRRVGKICHLRLKSPFIVETVQDRPVVATER